MIKVTCSLTHEELKKVHEEGNDEHDDKDLGFFVRDPGQSPAHHVFKEGEEPEEDEDDDLHRGEARNVDGGLLSPEGERERRAVVSRLVERLRVLAHQARRELQQPVEDEDAEGRVGDDVECVEGARVVGRVHRDEVADGDVARVDERLPDDLLRDVGEPDLPFPAWLFAHAFDDETAEDGGAHDALDREGERAEEAAGREVDFVAELLQDGGGDRRGRVGCSCEQWLEGVGHGHGSTRLILTSEVSSQPLEREIACQPRSDTTDRSVDSPCIKRGVPASVLPGGSTCPVGCLDRGRSSKRKRVGRIGARGGSFPSTKAVSGRKSDKSAA